jgi:hypothetical protein
MVGFPETCLTSGRTGGTGHSTMQTDIATTASPGAAQPPTLPRASLARPRPGGPRSLIERIAAVVRAANRAGVPF